MINGLKFVTLGLQCLFCWRQKAIGDLLIKHIHKRLHADGIDDLLGYSKPLPIIVATPTGHGHPHKSSSEAEESSRLMQVANSYK